MYRVVLGLLALLVGLGIVVIGWTAPAAVCFDGRCSSVDGSQLVFAVSLLAGFGTAGVGVRSIWRGLAADGG